MVGRMALRLFLWPGNLVCDAIGVRGEDDRSMIRTLINMLVWDFAGVLLVVLLW